MKFQLTFKIRTIILFLFTTFFVGGVCIYIGYYGYKGGSIGLLERATNGESLEGLKIILQEQAIFTTGIMLLSLILLGILFGKKLSAPIEELTAYIRCFKNKRGTCHGNRSCECLKKIIEDKTEIGTVAKEFNELMDIISGTTISIDLLQKEMVDRKKAEEKIKYSAYHDVLTGVYNRNYLEEELKRINVARSYPLSILVIDINHLKFVNDTLGHGKGDVVIQQVAEILKRNVRKEDIIARTGGDEFIILLKNISAERSQELIDNFYKDYKKFKSSKISLPFSFAIGHQTIEKQVSHSELNRIISNADKDMYLNKMDIEGTVQKEFLDGLYQIMKHKDYVTEEHEKRMSYFAIELGKAIGLKNSMIRDLRIATHLHDIGKVGIPDRILHKPNKLGEKDWKLMKAHTKIGYTLLNGISQFSRIATDVLYHHEKWNGTGYPEKIKGRSIPINSRIIHIVDAFDAMTHERPYQKTKTQKEAISEIKKLSNVQFDPELVEKFINIVNRKDTK